MNDKTIYEDSKRDTIDMAKILTGLFGTAALILWLFGASMWPAMILWALFMVFNYSLHVFANTQE